MIYTSYKYNELLCTTRCAL